MVSKTPWICLPSIPLYGELYSGLRQWLFRSRRSVIWLPVFGGPLPLYVHTPCSPQDLSYLPRLVSLLVWPWPLDSQYPFAYGHNDYGSEERLNPWSQFFVALSSDAWPLYQSNQGAVLTDTAASELPQPLCCVHLMITHLMRARAMCFIPQETYESPLSYGVNNLLPDPINLIILNLKSVTALCV